MLLFQKFIFVFWILIFWRNIHEFLLFVMLATIKELPLEDYRLIFIEYHIYFYSIFFNDSLSNL